MTKLRPIAVLLAATLPMAVPMVAMAQTAATPDAHAAMAPKAKYLQYLPAGLFDPSLLLPAPPAKGSDAEARDLETLRRLIASASKERIEQAHSDAVNEDPAIFNTVAGVDLKTLPATWELLTIVHEDAALAANYSKTFFKRMRPYNVDPSIPFCEGTPDQSKPNMKSYPSGHSTLGYSVGWMLARLMPGKADKILARAQDYALSRQYCGAHFASDTQAAHVLGTLAAATLYADPRLAGKIAAARAELAKF
jgi:acid phosphatase (class A)